MRGWTLSGRSCLARVAPAARRASPVARASPRSCWEVPDALGSPSRAGVASRAPRLRASCQTVGIAAECVVTVRIISSLQVSVALILCG